MVDIRQGSAEAVGAVSELTVSGMNCANCVRHVTESLLSVPGVAAANVSLPESKAVIHWQSGRAVHAQELMDAVESAGFKAEPFQPRAPGKSSGFISTWKFNVIVGAIVTAPLMAGEWVFGWGNQAWFAWGSFGLALVVQVVCGARFYRGAWRQLRVGGSNMDTLVSLGSTTAFLYSAWALFTGLGTHLYFMEAAAVITLISIGHWMEELAMERAEYSMRALYQLAPETALISNPDGSTKEIPVAQLHEGEVILLRPGARVPTDGEVIDGQSSVNESMLTGESLPVEKSPGKKVYAGTMNVDGRVFVRVTGLGEKTALARIVAAVQRAQSSRAQIQRLADRISNVFVPFVIGIAIAAGLWWGLGFKEAQAVHSRMAHYLWGSHLPTTALAAGILNAVAVLIVACPCAMGLATPVAIMAGTSAAARRGLLIRDGVALEKAGRLTAVLLDKTGTMTSGQPKVVESNILFGGDEALPLAADLARNSSHPLSLAVAGLHPPRSKLDQWREIRGSGIEASLRGAVIRLGSMAWLQSLGVNTSDGARFADDWARQGATLLGLGQGDRLMAVLALRDSPKPGLAEAVSRLKRQGLKVFMVTGDNEKTARAIATVAGIDPECVHAELQPGQKAALVARLEETGERVAFVGDGINDAPALEQADLGIAVSQASDVAGEAADIILLRTEIAAVPEAIDLARAALRTVKQNLFWAFFYNAAAVPLAALGFLSPILCAAAMGLSDLVVIGNAVRLSRWRGQN
jgi:Cu+-exporting ATPase